MKHGVVQQSYGQPDHHTSLNMNWPAILNTYINLVLPRISKKNHK